MYSRLLQRMGISARLYGDISWYGTYCSGGSENLKTTALLITKPIPLQALTGPEGSRRLRLPDFKTIGT
jgi:hypothetical protein